MPKLNEVKRSNEIGKRSNKKVIWHACIDCGKERWVPFLKGQAQINKQQKEIENLKERVTLLEAENISLKSKDILAH